MLSACLKKNSLSQSLYFHFFMLLALYLCPSFLGQVLRGEERWPRGGMRTQGERKKDFGEGSGIYLCGLLRSSWCVLFHLALSWKRGDTASVSGPDAMSPGNDVGACKVADCGLFGPWSLEVQVEPLLAS